MNTRLFLSVSILFTIIFTGCASKGNLASKEVSESTKNWEKEKKKMKERERERERERKWNSLHSEWVKLHRIQKKIFASCWSATEGQWVILIKQERIERRWGRERESFGRSTLIKRGNNSREYTFTS